MSIIAAAEIVVTGLNHALTTDGWPRDGQFMIDELRKLLPADCPGNKIFPVSYKSFKDLTPTQLNKVNTFMEGLTFEIRDQAKIEAIRKSRLTTILQNSNEVITTADDKARLVQLIAVPEVKIILIRVLTPLDRTRLDQPGNAVDDGWDELAGHFNNYELHNFKNVTLKYDEEGNQVRGLIADYEPADPSFKKISKKTNRLNPCNLLRQQHVRNGKWFKKIYADLKRDLSKVIYIYTHLYM